MCLVVCGFLLESLRLVLIMLIRLSCGKLWFLVMSCVLMMMLMCFFVILVSFECIVLIEVMRLFDSIMVCVFGNSVVVFFCNCLMLGLMVISDFLVE